MKLDTDKIKQTILKIKEIWSGYSLQKKLLILGVVTAILISICFLVSKNDNRAYEILYKDLNPKDAAAIVNKLEENKIKYELADENQTILVPAELKYNTRLKMAAENLPQGQAGFEIFNDTNFGETQADKKVKYQIALQGELARTIESIEKIKAARVHLALPEKTLFSDYEQKPSASIQITFHDDKGLTNREIQGIKNLVANSVDSLQAEDVVIIDQQGNLISDINSADNDNQTEQIRLQLELKKAYEKEKQQAMQEMLDRSLGKGNSVVQVNLDLNFDSKEEKETKFEHDEDGPFIVSEHSLKESGTNNSQPPQGTPGTDGNVPQYTEVQSDIANSLFEKKDTTRNYELNRTETVTRYAIGETRYDYLTAAVIVNSKIADNLGQNEEERIRKVRNIIAAACGLRASNENVNLQENVSVAFIDFYDTENPQDLGANKILQLSWIPWVIALLITLSGIVIFIFIKRNKEKRMALQTENDDVESVDGLDIESDEDIDLEEVLVRPPLSPEEKQRQEIINEVEKLIKEDPESTAQVIKTWLLEDQR